MQKILVIKNAQVGGGNPISAMARFEYWKRNGTATFYKTVFNEDGSRAAAKKVTLLDPSECESYTIARGDYGECPQTITLVGAIDRSDQLLFDVAKEMGDFFFNEPKGRLTPKPEVEIIEIPNDVRWHIEKWDCGSSTRGTYNEYVVENHREWFF